MIKLIPMRRYWFKLPGRNPEVLTTYTGYTSGDDRVCDVCREEGRGAHEFLAGDPGHAKYGYYVGASCLRKCRIRPEAATEGMMRTMRQMFEATVDDPGSLWHGAEYISVYSRAQAIEDGDLVDVSDDARQAGFKWPVALTNALFSAISKVSRGSGEDWKGRLWDILSVLRMKARSGGDQVRFTVKFGGRNHQLLSVVGPGDTPAPVITIGYPGDF